MQKLPTKPLLPDDKVATVLISSEYPDIALKLRQLFGVQTIEIPYADKLSSDISTHPDCRFLQISSNCIIIDESIKPPIVKKLTIGGLMEKVRIIVSEKHVESPYPGDVKLNVTVANKKIICNTKYIDNSIRKFAEMHLFDLIHANQGYSACSVILLNDNALITDDESIYYAAESIGFDCLLIRKGSVKLKGHEYGFIGGTYGMMNKNLIVFTGRLDTHVDSNLIKDFLLKHNIDYVELTDGSLIDVGGIIPLTQIE